MSDDIGRLFLFDTTNHAMWAEEVAQDRSVPAELVNAPPEAEDKCGLALRTLPDRIPTLESAFSEVGIPYELTSD